MSSWSARASALVLVVSAMSFGGCSHDGPDLTEPEPAPTPTPAQGIVVNPDGLIFTFSGEEALVNVSYKGQVAVPFTRQVVDPAIASASWISFNNNSSFAVLKVTALLAGSTSIQFGIEGTAERASMPVTVENDFTRTVGIFTGEVVKEASPLTAGRARVPSCPGGSSYGETVTVTLDRSGNGSFLVQDTPNFDRRYSASGPSGTSFASHGTFPFVGLDVPGDLSVMFTDSHTMKFRETTTYGTGASACGSTYGGTLVRP